MPLTYLIAQLIGIFCLVVGAAILVQKKDFVAIVDELVKSPALLYILGFISLLLGLLVVLTHDVWNAGFLPLIVTLLGWIMVLRGVSALFISHGTLMRWIRLARIEQLAWLYAAILLVFGAYLTYAGFMH